MQSLKNYLSINTITEKLLLLAKRFPISILLVAITEYYNEMFLLDFEDSFSGRGDLFMRAYIFLTIGVFISAAAALWSEDIVGYVKQYFITFAAVLLWGVYCFFLSGWSLHDEARDFPSYWVYEIGATGWVATLSVYFISFLKRDTDKAFWNFAVRTLFQYFLAICFGLIILGGLCGAFALVGALFKVDIPERVYGSLVSICLVLFAHLYFLANIPDKNAKHDAKMRLGKSLKALGLYVLAPLVAVYAVILYVYLFSIIIDWELPQGFVSNLVLSLVCVGFLTIFILYPARMEEKNKAVVYLSRYFGAAMLPLLVLMTVGTLRRFDDYGITIRRGYLIVMNVWLYGVCAYHFITKARRIKWILISFAAVALLSSTRFCGVPDVTKYILTAEVRGYVGGRKISVSDKALFDELGEENRKKIAWKIEYLRTTYGFESVKAFFESGATEKYVRNFEGLWEYGDTLATEEDRI